MNKPGVLRKVMGEFVRRMGHRRLVLSLAAATLPNRGRARGLTGVNRRLRRTCAGAEIRYLKGPKTHVGARV
jgi:hypothetical protein